MRSFFSLRALDFVAAAIIAVAAVQRLVHVAHNVDEPDERTRKLLLRCDIRRYNDKKRPSAHRGVILLSSSDLVSTLPLFSLTSLEQNGPDAPRLSSTFQRNADEFLFEGE